MPPAALISVLNAAEPTWTDKLSAIAATVAAGATTLTLLVVGAGWLLARAQLEEMKRSRHAQVMADYISRWDGDQLIDARRAVIDIGSEKLRHEIERLYRRNERKYYELMRVPAFFEDLATLEAHGSLSSELLSQHFGAIVVHEFDQWSPTIDFLRERGGSGLEGFERLAAAELERRGLAVATVRGPSWRRRFFLGSGI